MNLPINNHYPELLNVNMNRYEVLIVDNDEDTINLCSDTLTEKNIVTFFARNGKRALQSLQKKIPDLILLDILMDDMDGWEVCRQLKQNSITKDIPVIFLTAMQSKEDTVKGFEAGGVDYITKPFHKQELLARVITHLELKKANDIIRHQTIALTQQNDELKQLNSTKDRFFSIISHDLKNVFQTLIPVSDLMIKNVTQKNYVDLKEHLDMLNQSTKHGYELMENLFKWAKTQRNTITFTPVTCEIYKTVVNTALQFKPILSDKNLILHIQQLSSEIEVMSDVEMLSFIIRNLLGNAIKFSHRGGNIWIKFETENQFVKVSVSDQGVGISLQNMTKLFKIEEQKTTKGTNGEQGTGLGLILCKEFAEKNGGKIWAESQHLQGSTMTFTVPLFLG